MKKSTHLLARSALLVLILVSAVLLATHAYAQTTDPQAADLQRTASDAQQAQAAQATAATAATAAQQCATQNNTSCATTQMQAATAAANQASMDTADASAIATNDASTADGKQIEANTAAAQAATAAAEASASAAATDANQPAIAAQEATAAHNATVATQSSATSATAPASTGTTGSNFVPLTALPGLTNVTSSSANFIALFNNLYKICIGVGAALAFFEIVWAGVTWMTAGDSTEKVGEARKRIGNAVLGLLLVLSPVIVFGIINPNVLSLTLNVSALTPTQTSGTVAAGAATSAPAPGTVGSTVAAVNGKCPSNAAPVSGSTTQCTVTSPPAAGAMGSTCTNNTQCTDPMVCDDVTSTCQTDSTTVFSCNDDSSPTQSADGQSTCANGTTPSNIDGVNAPTDGTVTVGGSCAGNPDACSGDNTICGTNNICQNSNGTAAGGVPGNETLSAGGDCEQNSQACSSGLVCQTNAGTDDTCVASSGYTGQVSCDVGSVAAGSSCYPCPDGTNADNAGDCDGTDF